MPLPSIEEPKGEYPTYITQESGKVVPVVQVLFHIGSMRSCLDFWSISFLKAYCYTKYLGQLRLRFDSSGDLMTPVPSEVTIFTRPIRLLNKNIF